MPCSFRDLAQSFLYDQLHLSQQYIPSEAEPYAKHLSVLPSCARTMLHA